MARLKECLRLAHRYASLVLAAFWLFQILTGVMLVFHWEIDDASVPGRATVLDPAGIGRTLETLQAEHPKGPVSLYASGSNLGRFDILAMSPSGSTDAYRVDGAGQILRIRPWDHDLLHIGLFQLATYLHQTLFAGSIGRVLIGVSGLVLVTNIAMAVSLAWPQVGRWRRSLVPRRGKTVQATVLSWHRAMGLWLAPLAMATIGAGAVLAFDAPLRALLNIDPPPPSATELSRASGGAPTSAEAAIRLSLSRFPRANLASVRLPWPDAPYYAVALRQPGEARRFDGDTMVFVSERGGRVLAVQDALTLPIKTRLMNSLYAVHTGEIGGLGGRVLAVFVAIGLTLLGGLGVGLWASRRRPRPAPHQAR